MNSTTLPLPARLSSEEVKEPTNPAWSFPGPLAAASKNTQYFFSSRIVTPLAGVILGAARGLGLVFVASLAIADGFVTQLIAMPTACRLARARGSWLHRWSRVARFVLGLRTTARGHTPVSGVVVAHYTSLLDALVLAALHPCVFVAGEELRRRPLLGLLARFGGTIFVRSSSRVDLRLALFTIERAVLRRQIVVIFPECNPGRGFTSALFQPATDLGCTVTATAIDYGASRETAESEPALRQESGLSAHLSRLITRRHNPVTVAFDGPRFHRGDRKNLARQLRSELRALDTVTSLIDATLPSPAEN